MKEIRCPNCKKLLGKIDGEFEIKCSRCSCVNRGSTVEGTHQCVYKAHVELKNRKTSSGVTFG